MSSWIVAATIPRRMQRSPTATMTMRWDSSGIAVVAMFPSTQTSAALAKPAGAQASRSGSAATGAEPVTRATREWNGIAPIRTATAKAIAR